MRQYEETHPWIDFKLDLNRLPYTTWLLVGEALSKCEHVAGTPLHPAVAKDLRSIYLTKGVHATTSIEGNTLSEEAVRDRIEHGGSLPPSQEYLGQEVDNIVRAYNLIVRDVGVGRSRGLTPERVMELNRIVLDGVPLDEGAVPGVIRRNSVVAGNVYRGAPAADCEYLLEQLCDWLTKSHTTDGTLGKSVALLSAIVAHLYLAWIHPFDDGNGRTARLIEFQLLVRSGIPIVAAHLLSDHYNRTRTEYARILALTSRPPHDPVEDFISYALQGFVDELREQVDAIRAHQRGVIWRDMIYGAFRDKDNTPARRRQRLLVLSLPTGVVTARAMLRELTPQLAIAYAGKSQKTVTRDLNALDEKGLIVKSHDGVRPRTEQVEAFLPWRAEPGAG